MHGGERASSSVARVAFGQDVKYTPRHNSSGPPKIPLTATFLLLAALLQRGDVALDGLALLLELFDRALQPRDVILDKLDALRDVVLHLHKLLLHEHRPDQLEDGGVLLQKVELLCARGREANKW